MTVDTVDIQYFIPGTDIVVTIPEGGDSEHSIHSKRSRKFSDIIIYMYNNTKRLATSKRLFIRTNEVRKLHGIIFLFDTDTSEGKDVVS